MMVMNFTFSNILLLIPIQFAPTALPVWLLMPTSEDDVLHLSVREYDVLNLLVKGKSYKMIASELNVSYETVHSHIKKLYQKLQVNSVGEALSKTLTKNILGKIMVLIAAIFMPG